MNSIPFNEPVLFLEFYVREVTYSGKDQSAKYPAGTLFYEGKSLALQGSVPSFREDAFKKKPQSILPQSYSFAILDGKPCLLASQKRKFQHWVANHPLDALLLIGREALNEDQWIRENNREVYSILLPGISRFTDIVNHAPFRFNVWGQDEAGTLLTDFPNAEVRQTLEVGSTYLFLCRQEEYFYKEYMLNPHRNLCLFVKNHGLHRQIELVSTEDFAAYDVANLCTEPHKLRDHRKSRYKYLLG